MIVGLDFDNTIVRYDGLFHAEAVRRGLVPAATPKSKEAVRDALRAAGREDDWTELQGWAYGPGMERAEAFPGAREFVAECRRRGAKVRVISHRTRKPFKGPAHDLHAAAKAWLERSGFLADDGLAADEVFFEETKQDKLARISETGCTHFVDDLPEFLAEPSFPKGVERVHFDPSGSPAGGRFPRAASWAEVGRLVLDSAGLESAVAALLPGRGAAKLTRVEGSANNRVFRVSGGGPDLLLKSYFTDRDDARRRQQAEWDFARFAWSQGLRSLAEPVAADLEAGVSLFAWLEGRRPAPGEANASRVAEAAVFFSSLNAHRAHPDARALPEASEAAFSLAGHARLVAGRVERLLDLERDDADAAAAADFVEKELRPALAAARGGLDDDRPLDERFRLLSPSDFGFHNALLDESGVLRFVDFEYAGWDDPAKTVCDFFLQPAVPAPASAREAFTAALALTAGDAGLARRAARLAPLYRVKWACIALNDFLPAGRRRRLFSLGAEAFAARRKNQLALARRLLLAPEPS